MKLTILTVFWTSVIVFALVPVEVKYTQIFADRIITLTERMTRLERGNLPNKKGFIQFGNIKQ